MTGRPKFAADLEERTLVHDGVDDGAHLVDLPAIARHCRQQGFFQAFGIVVARKRRRQFIDRLRQVRQEAPRAGKSFLLGLHRLIDAAGARLNIRPAEFLLAKVLAQPLHHRRTRDKHRGAFGHHRIMAGGKPSGAETRDRAEPKPDHRHASEVGSRISVPTGATDAARQIGRALGFDGLHRPSAAGAFDQADDRQPKIMGHFLGHQRLGRDRSIRRAAAHRKVIADHDHRAAVDLAAAEHAVGRGDVLQLALLVIFRGAGYGADFVKAVAIEQAVDAFANGKPALVALALDLVGAAHLAGEGFAPGQFVELRLPVHSNPLH